MFRDNRIRQKDYLRQTDFSISVLNKNPLTLLTSLHNTYTKGERAICADGQIRAVHITIKFAFH